MSNENEANIGDQVHLDSGVVPFTEVTVLDRYSLRGKLAELEKQTVAAIPFLGNLALLGQFTIFFAPPNTGKTVITLSLIIKAIESASVKPDQIYYLNLDDSGTGLVTKLGLAETHGFHMLAEGENGFKAARFLDDINEMINANQCLGTVVVLDTLKKFIDVMDKSRARTFTSVMRLFVQKGGTVIALGHTNKRTNPNGRAVYGGVSDFLDDADAAYIVCTVGDSDAESKVVVFENIKKRGDVASKASYRYLNVEGTPYTELVMSVELVGTEELNVIEEAADLKADKEIIDLILKCIDTGINTKMRIVKEVSRVTKLSNRDAIRIIEQYTGSDPRKHRWTFEMGAHGAQKYVSFY